MHYPLPVALGFNHNAVMHTSLRYVSTIGQCMAALLMIQQIFRSFFRGQNRSLISQRWADRT